MKSQASLEASPHLQDRVPVARRFPSWLIPVGILLGFCLLFFLLFGDRLLPAKAVQVSIVLAAPASEPTSRLPVAKPASETASLFQASGWIEPSPLPVKATALVDGVIDTVKVLPGQEVKKGDLLATLIPDDARLALAGAEQRLKLLNSTLTAHRSAIIAARKKLDAQQAQVISAATLRDEAVDQLKRLEPLLPSSAVSESEVIRARLRVSREESQLQSANYSAEEMKAEVDRLEAEDQVKQDEIRGAAIEVEKAELAVQRTQIPSPIDGRVLRLHAAPGQKKMLQDQDPESSTVAILYRPDQLQIRVDVPLADAGKLQPGQRVRSRCSLFPDRILNGEVILITGEADLQRNTLQAKVSIEDPARELRPEMLCRVEFLASRDSKKIADAPADTLACWVPTAAVTPDHEVWVCDPESKRVQKRSVKPTNEQREGYLCISEGLMPGEWVVLSPQGLREGQRVHPNLVEK